VSPSYATTERYRLRIDVQTIEVEDYIGGISFEFNVGESSQGPSEPDGLSYAGSHAAMEGFYQGLA
jgi:hypothetical protein